MFMFRSETPCARSITSICAKLPTATVCNLHLSIRPGVWNTCCNILSAQIPLHTASIPLSGEYFGCAAIGMLQPQGVPLESSLTLHRPFPHYDTCRRLRLLAAQPGAGIHASHNRGPADSPGTPSCAADDSRGAARDSATMRWGWVCDCMHVEAVPCSFVTSPWAVAGWLNIHLRKASRCSAL
jgi:hypothetical protein